MRGARPVRSARLWMAIFGVVVVLAGGALFIRSLAHSKEAFGSVPDGYLSELLWEDGYLYFVRQPSYSSQGANELWRVAPRGDAHRLDIGAPLRCGIGGRVEPVSGSEVRSPGRVR
jgi:hypothetical protein